MRRATLPRSRAHRRASTLCAALLAWFVASTAAARAPDTFEEAYARPAVIDSPMWWAFEFKLGPYRPDNDAQRQVFSGDRGWLLSLELDVTLFHIPYVGQINAGAGWGWAKYDAKALLAAGGGRSGESTKLIIYPMSALAVLRIDSLARYTPVPLTFAGKIGYDFVRWVASTGKRDEADGLNKGLRWGVQGAFELDFFDIQAARRMDDEWGINHTFLLFEYYESMTKGTGDRSFSFGLGMQF
jgi:hypothetical protein